MIIQTIRPGDISITSLPFHAILDPLQSSGFEVVVNVDPENKSITVLRLQEPLRSQSVIGMLGSSKNHKIAETKHLKK